MKSVKLLIVNKAIHTFLSTMLKKHQINEPVIKTAALTQIIVALLFLSSSAGVMMFLVTMAKLVRASPDVTSPNSICNVIICEADRTMRRPSPMRGIIADRKIPVQERILM